MTGKITVTEYATSEEVLAWLCYPDPYPTWGKAFLTLAEAREFSLNWSYIHNVTIKPLKEFKSSVSTVRFYKKILQSSSGRVEAYVYDENEVCVGWEWFFTFSQEYRLKKAHLWADKYIKNCEKYVGEFK